MNNITLLDGPSQQQKLTVTTTVVVEAKGGTTALENRQVLTMQGSGKFYVYFGADDGSTPSVSEVQNNGFWQYKNVKESYEAGASQKVWLLAVSATVEVVICERQ